MSVANCQCKCCQKIGGSTWKKIKCSICGSEFSAYRSSRIVVGDNECTKCQAEKMWLKIEQDDPGFMDRLKEKFKKDLK